MSEFVVNKKARKELAHYLKRLRKEREFGLNQLSNNAGIQKTILSRLEKGEIQKINPFFLKQLSKALRIDYKELYKIVDYLDEKDFGTSEITLKNSEVDITDDKVVQLPVYGRASAGNGYINLENIISYKRVLANGFSKDSFVVEVHGDSMADRINDGDFAVVDPQQKDYSEGKVYVVTYERETYIKQVVQPDKNLIVLKSFNPEYEDKYIMKDDVENLKIEGRVVKVVSERRF